MTDATEMQIRAALQERDPGPPPGSLAERIRTDRAGTQALSTWSARTAHWATPIAGLAAIVAFAVIGATIWTQRGQSGTVGAPPAPVPAAPPVFDPTANGAGIVERPTDLLIWVVVAAIAVIATVLIVVARRRVIRAVVLVGAAAVALWMVNALSQPLVDWTQGAWQYGQGWVPPTPGAAPPDAQAGQERARFVVGPNGVFTVGLDVHNLAPLPVTIVGVSRPPAEEFWGHWSAVGLARDPNAVDIPTPAKTRAFEPVEVRPGESVFLVLAGRAGPCALAQVPADGQDLATATVGTVDVVYEIAGIRSLSTVTMPFAVELPVAQSCAVP